MKIQMLKKKNFVHFVSRPPGRNLLKHIFWQKYSRVFQSSEVSKVWKIELCTFCEPPVCWNITQNHLFDNSRRFQFEVSEGLKKLKNKLWSFCKPSAWWKTTQTHLLTKVEDFERFETSKPWKFKLCSFCNRQLGKKLPKHTFDKNLNLQKLEKANFAHFVNHMLDEKLLQDLTCRKWRILKTLKIQKLEKTNWCHFVRSLFDEKMLNNLFWQNYVLRKRGRKQNLKIVKKRVKSQVFSSRMGNPIDFSSRKWTLSEK